jgi:hypothetical protein
MRVHRWSSIEARQFSNCLKMIKEMKIKFGLLVASMLLVFGCSTKKPLHEVKVNNPEFIPDTAFVSFEDLSSPKFKALKEKYQLDTIFHD